MLTSKELREKRLRILEQQKDIYAAAQKEGRTTLNAEEDGRFNKFESDFAEMSRDIERLEKMESRDAEMAVAQYEAQARAQGYTTANTLPEDPEKRYSATFSKFLRYGEHGLNPEERQDIEKRAQTVSTTGGGYLVPTGFSNQLETIMKWFGPMIDPMVTGSLDTDSGNTLHYPTLNDTSNTGRLLTINTQVTTTDMTFGNVQFDAYKYTSDQVLVPYELMQDSGVNVDEVVQNALGERLGRIINTALTTGSGSSQPNGVVTASTAGKTAASATAITAAELIDLIHSVDRAYSNGPKVGFMFNDSTLAAIKKLTLGGSDSTPLWVPSTRDGEPDTIWGHRFWVNNDMAAIATTAKTILFGDFSKYLVRRVAGIRMLRMVERYGDYDQIGFVAFYRIDGDLIASGSIKHLVQA